MKRQDFDRKLAEYVTTRFIPSVTSPVAKFVLGAAAGAGALSVGLVGDEALGLLKIAGAGGDIDVDALKRAVYGGFDAAKDAGLPVNRFGIGKLERSDAEAFFSWLESPPPPAA